VDKAGWNTGQAGLGVTYPLWVPGRYYSQPNLLTASTGDFTKNTYAFPFYFPGANGVVIDQIGFEVTIAGLAGGTARLAIYDDKEGVPCDLVLDAGAAVIDAVGFQSAAVNIRLRGWQWIAVMFDSYTPTTPRLRSANNIVNNLGTAIPQTRQPPPGFRFVSSHGAFGAGWPDRFPPYGQDYSITVSFPRLLVRAA
jgi:hypothetical protein